MRTASFLIVILIVAALAVPAAAPVQAQVPAGTEFLVTLPAFISFAERNDTSFKFRFEVYCSRPTKVSVRWANTGSYLVQDAQLNAGERLVIMKPQFDINQIVQSDERYLADTINMRAFWVTADQPVSVHATFDKNYRTETYTAMPISSYDTNYTVIDYSGFSYYGARGGFLITAAEDSTRITINPGADVYTQKVAERLKGMPFTITLQKHQIYQVLAGQLNQGFASDMSGTIIHATKPIGVLPFSKATNVPVTKLPTDALPEKSGFDEWYTSVKTIMNPQLPDSKAGTTFYAVPLSQQNKTRIRIIATQFGTTITMNGKPAVMKFGSAPATSTFNTGAVFDTVITEPTVFEASKPVVAVQLAYSGSKGSASDPTMVEFLPGDPMMVSLFPSGYYKPSLQWVSPLLDAHPAKGGNSQVLYPWNHYVIVTAPVEARGYVMLDGQPIDLPIDYSDGKYVSAIIRVTPRST